MTIRPKFALAALAIGALSAVALFYSLRPTQDRVVAATSVRSALSTQSSSVASSGGAGMLGSPQSPPSSTEGGALLLSELAKAANYKKVFEDGKASIPRGGLYVAGLVNQRCSDVRNLLAEPRQTDASTTHAEAYKIQAAAGRLESLCSGMIDEDVDFQKGYVAFLRTVDRRADPLLRMKDDYAQSFSTGDKSGLSAGILQALKVSSPEFFQNLTLPVKDGAYYFDGRSYSLGADGESRVLEAGKLLAVCEIWGRCGSETDYYLLRACASQGQCESSYQGLVSRQLTADQVAQAQRIAKTMAAAAASGDVTPFIPK